MPTQSALTDRQVAPAQVWAKLSVEIQIRAIGLLAQLIPLAKPDARDTGAKHRKFPRRLRLDGVF